MNGVAIIYLLIILSFAVILHKHVFRLRDQGLHLLEECCAQRGQGQDQLL